MKKNGMIITGILAVLLIGLTGCAPNRDQSGTQNVPASAARENVQLRVFSLQELAQYNGKNGNPAYVAVDGMVYDVTKVPQWAGGTHFQVVNAGLDLSREIRKAPHGLSVLSKLPVVGTVKN